MRKIELPRARPSVARDIEAPVSETNVGSLALEDQTRPMSVPDYDNLRRELRKKGQEKLASLQGPFDEPTSSLAAEAHSTAIGPSHSPTLQVTSNSSSFPSGLVWMLVPFAGLLTVGAMRSIMHAVLKEP